MKFIAITTETNICECCGKADLKKVVVMAKADGQIVRYGVDCAARALGHKRGTAIKTEVAVMEYAQKWLKVYSAEIVARGVWNKFGFLTTAKDNTLVIHGVGEISK